jgi:hypothetical protein
MSIRRFLWFAFVSGVCLASGTASRAEHCWAYVDGDFEDYESAKVPIICVEEGDLLCTDGPGIDAVNPNCGQEGGDECCCDWDPTCHVDSNTDDCCTSVPPPAGTEQTILDMHTAWHECFGSVGTANPPPGRSARWLAFHRQFEYDFDLFREDQFGCDPGEEGDGCFIEALDWVPNMVMPYGHFGAGDPGDHPRNCGLGPNRPNNVTCESCQALPECVFYPGMGPIGGDPTPGCGAFPAFGSLDDFTNMDDLAKVLDESFHGNMHIQVGAPFTGTCSDDADCGDHPGDAVCEPVFGVNRCVYTRDVHFPTCSPRDPMFWRLHKALDDTVRAWQENQALDVTVVLDRSGSMGDLDSSGEAKIAVAYSALDLFADLLEDGAGHRIGLVSYAGNASNGALNMPLTDVDLAAGPLATVKSNIGLDPVGCTSIGSGIQGAMDQLCNGSSDGETSCDPVDGHAVPDGENPHKAILLLTDGHENRQPCLSSAGDPTPSCGGVCGGDQFDLRTLGPHTQLCAVGFGQEGSVNGNLLTLIAERQGGIYMQSPALGPDDGGGSDWVDLKNFFVKCFGILSDETNAIDPEGTMAAGELATEVVEYTSCGDGKLTFVGGWNVPAEPGDLRILVTAPSGDLVRSAAPTVEGSLKPEWSFQRVRLPHGGDDTGTWRAQLIRRHHRFVNAFTTDSFVDLEGQGVPLVRRQIQRLCPDGCPTVLYFEDGRLGPQSAYELAIAAESAAGVLGSVTSATGAADFAARLESGAWDLIVYANQTSPGEQVFDVALQRVLCTPGQRAILTDTRGNDTVRSGIFHHCSGAAVGSRRNWTEVVGDGRLVDGVIELANPGYPTFSYGIHARAPAIGEFDLGAAELQATHDRLPSTAFEPSGLIVAATFVSSRRLSAQEWFADVLVRGPSRLDQHAMRVDVRTGEGLLPSVRVLPANIPARGYDEVVATVDVEYPLSGNGVGRTLIAAGLPDPGPATPGDDRLDGRAAALAASPTIPTARRTYVLNDDGVDGDLHAGNGYWSTHIEDIAPVDGMYRFHFKVDFTKDGCTTHRELQQSIFMDVGVDPGSSRIEATPTADGIEVSFFPQDEFGNPVGWGRPPTPTCGPEPACTCDPADVVDHGDGTYTLPIRTAPGVSACTFEAFDEEFVAEVPVDRLGHQVGLFLGGFLSDDDLPLNSGPDVGFRYRRNRFRPSWSWEYEVGMAFTDDGVDDGTLASLQLQWVRHLGSASAAVQPFLLGGVGVAHYNTLGTSDTGPLVVLGGGADYRWSERVGFRLDLRLLGLDDMVGEGWTTNLQVLWGPTFSF